MSKVVEIIPSHDVAAAQEQLATYGHLAVVGAYDADLAAAALAETQSGKLHSEWVIGGQVGNLALAGDNLRRLVAGITGFVGQLGRSIKPTVDEHLKTQIIWQQAGAVGGWHTDSEQLVDVVAITNFKGTSTLEIRGADGQPDATYPVEPGVTVFLDHNRRLVHRGIAGPAERAGLVFARESRL